MILVPVLRLNKPFYIGNIESHIVASCPSSKALYLPQAISFKIKSQIGQQISGLRQALGYEPGKAEVGCEQCELLSCERGVAWPHSLSFGAVAVHAAVRGLPAGLPGHPVPHLHRQAGFRASLDSAPELFTPCFCRNRNPKPSEFCHGCPVTEQAGQHPEPANEKSCASVLRDAAKVF